MVSWVPYLLTAQFRSQLQCDYQPPTSERAKCWPAPQRKGTQNLMSGHTLPSGFLIVESGRTGAVVS